MGNNIKLSIITINYNSREGLHKTIESVVSQTFQDFEYVVIDGGSMDGSAEVITEYADKIDYWVSEPDGGIYPAMNKGVKAAHGEYTLFLNSGDTLYRNDVLEMFFRNDIKADIACGDITNDKGGIFAAPEKVTMEYFLLGCLPHPSSFIRRSLFEEHPYDERFKIAGDWEFFMHHLITRNVSYQHVDMIVTLFDTNGISCTTNKDEHDAKLRKEAISRILYPRVREDYDVFMGKREEYHRLFYTLSHTKHKRAVYSIVVFILKILMINRGWIKEFNLTGRRNSR